MRRSALAAGTSDDRVLGGRLMLTQPRRGHRVGHDAILLDPVKILRKLHSRGSLVGRLRRNKRGRKPNVPAQAATQADRLKAFSKRLWIPACAGMSGSKWWTNSNEMRSRPDICPPSSVLSFDN